MEGMVQSVKCLSCKHKILNLVHQNHYKNTRFVAHICNPSTGEWRQEDPCDSLPSVTSLIAKLQAAERPTSKGVDGVCKDGTQGLCLPNSSIHVCISLHVHARTHTQAF